MQDVTDEMAQQIIAANLKRLRGTTSFSEVGRRASTSAGAIRDIEENGRMPGAGLLTRLADAFGVQITEFLKPSRNSKKTA